MTEPSHAVFLSYASQDAEAAQKICEALCAAGIEVWFDQSELGGGDAWDQSIRKQIKTCALFVPIISIHTHERAEGYFRLEWKLAVDRSHLITSHKAFLLPVVIDATSEQEEHVPDKFREVQWTRLPGGVTPAAFVERVRRLLTGELSQQLTGTTSVAHVSSAAATTGKPVFASRRSKASVLAALAVLVLALGYYAANRFAPPNRGSKVGEPPEPAAQNASATAFKPPPHSIAVLPFVNLSGDKEQEYFSDGLTEELLNSLAEINELRVAARTSSFSFRGKDTDIGTIARKLNVAAILEGSVRRSGNIVRVTTQLINAVTGFHLWSHTYDRDLGDVLKLETEIAGAVASALKVNLLGDVAMKIELGGTRDPTAFDAYLRATKASQSGKEQDAKNAVDLYTEALARDPNYALAYCGRSVALLQAASWVWFQETGDAKRPVGADATERDLLARGEADARQAMKLAPDLGEGHLALAYIFEYKLDFARATEEYERALSLAPGSVRVLRNFGIFSVMMGHTDAGITAVRQAVAMDPVNPASHISLFLTLWRARHYDEALTAAQHSILLDSTQMSVRLHEGLAYYMLGQFEKARVSCELESIPVDAQFCLAMTYHKLGRYADAKEALAKLERLSGPSDAFRNAEIFAQWGATSAALSLLDTAMRLRDPTLERLKVSCLLDPIRSEPRFQAIERALKFPD